jgi:hypothetical protein
MNSVDYLMIIDSEGRAQGSRNNGTYTVNFTNILSEKYALYTVETIFSTSPTFYTDLSGATSLVSYATAAVNIEFGSRPYAFDASNNTTSSLVGISHRQALSSTSPAYMLFDKNDSFPLTIANPSAGQIRIFITNLCNNTPFVSTNYQGVAQSDMSRWTMSLKFSPVPESFIENFH